MIEMLGVLAIVGVLSVGGIAGYSKAMEKWKIDRAISQYNMLIFGMTEHLDSIRKEAENKKEIMGLLNLALDLNLIPNSWLADNRSESFSNYGSKIADDNGNAIQLFYVPSEKIGDQSRMVFSLFMGGVADIDKNKTISPGFSKSFCISFLSDVVQPLHTNLLWVNIQGHTTLVGDSICSEKNKCLNSLKISDIDAMCSYCTKDNLCLIYLNF